jgi:hypothetical protein
MLENIYSIIYIMPKKRIVVYRSIVYNYLLGERSGSLSQFKDKMPILLVQISDVFLHRLNNQLAWIHIMKDKWLVRCDVEENIDPEMLSGICNVFGNASQDITQLRTTQVPGTILVIVNVVGYHTNHHSLQTPVGKRIMIILHSS